MYKTKLVHCCDVVPKLVVEIEIFVCLFVYLFVLLISQMENGPIMIPKTVLKSGL